ncbi:MAG: hypothetical protein ACJ72Z_08460 [Pyrinomonadaceae bacterium]
MQKKTFRLVSGMLAAFIVIAVGSYVIVAQSAVTGTWEASIKEKSPDKIHLSFERKTENGRNQNGSSYSFSELQGLSREQAANGRVNFRLVRDAGTIECEGTFVNGKGSGTFTFVANRGYIDAMRSRGFDFEKRSKEDDHEGSVEDRLLTAAMLNVSVALADDLRSAGFPNLDTGDLFKAAIFKVDGKFMSEMKATGFPNLGMEELVKARIFKIDADFVRKIKDMGFGTNDFENLVKYSIFKVTPEYLADLKAEGLTNLTAEDVVKCRIFKIDAEFIRKARADEPNLSVEDLVQMKIGVYRKTK